MARGVRHSDEKRAEALAGIVAGEAVISVAKRLEVSHATVIAWRDAAGLGSTHVEREKHASLADAVYLLVNDNVAALRAIASTALDPAWRHAQPAGELATFAGVLSDKTFRILAAIEAGQTDIEPRTALAAGVDGGA